MSTTQTNSTSRDHRRAVVRCLRLLAVDELWPHDIHANDDTINRIADELAEALLMIIQGAHAEDNLAALLNGVANEEYVHLNSDARTTVLKPTDMFVTVDSCWTRLSDVYDHDYEPMDEITVLVTNYEGENSGYNQETLDRFMAERPALDTEKIVEFGRAVHYLIGFHRRQHLKAVIARLEAARKPQNV